MTEVFKLSPEAFGKFLEICDNPPEPTERLKSLMRPANFDLSAALTAVRPLIIAEARVEIEAAERERVLEEVAKRLDDAGDLYQAELIRSLKAQP